VTVFSDLHKKIIIISLYWPLLVRPSGPRPHIAARRTTVGLERSSAGYKIYRSPWCRALCGVIGMSNDAVLWVFANFLAVGIFAKCRFTREYDDDNNIITRYRVWTSALDSTGNTIFARRNDRSRERKKITVHVLVFVWDSRRQNGFQIWKK